MSLFTLKDAWTFDIHESYQNFSIKSVTLANIDNENGPFAQVQKLLIGGYSGILRIISGTEPEDSNGKNLELDENIGYKGNLLAELHLGSPILQVEAGCFLGGSSNLHLAILHPQKLGLYTVSKVPGQVEHGSQYKVTLLYEHQLKRLAFNMCFGSFGQVKLRPQTSAPGRAASAAPTGSKRRDFICVQSLDGTLSFFEQEVFTFSRYLPNFLIPGPIVYVPPWDSFLTVSSSFDLECYQYLHLAMSQSDPNIQTQESSIGKKLTAEWKFSLGEESVGDIQVLTSSTDAEKSGVRVVVATFRNIFCFSVNGELTWCKRLDYPLSCFCSYLNNSNECITIVASSNESGALYIYSGTTLKWAAKLPFVPIYLGRMPIKDVSGGVVLLNSHGRLSVEYLGTEPSLFTAPTVESRDIDYEDAEKELILLRQIISEAGEQNIVATKDTSVEVKVEFEGQTSKFDDENGLEVIALIATIKIFCHVRVNDVRVTILTPRPIICSHESAHIGDIVGRHNYTVEFHVGNESIPSDLQCEVSVLYVSDDGAPHFIQKSGIKIPLFILMKPHDFLDKDGESKLTFSVNKPLINLVTLYNDFEWSPSASPNSLTFSLCGGERITLLASTKVNTTSTSRYRIQSDSIATIHLVFRDFLDRLHRKHGREKSDVEISVVGADNEIPLLSEYFEEVEAHILRRRRDAQIKEDLADRASQLRAIQRRLLLRFRDKNAVPLTQLETLMDGSLDHITDALNFMDYNDLDMKKSESRLSGATRLMLELSLIQGGRTSEELSQLSGALCPYVWDFIDDHGWEECVYTGLSYIKTQQVVSCPSLAQLDITKLKKLIKSTLQKVRKAAQPLKVSDKISTSQSNEPEILVGNEIVERMISARARTARKRVATLLASIPEPIEDDGEDRRSPLTQENFNGVNENGVGGVPNLAVNENSNEIILKVTVNDLEAILKNSNEPKLLGANANSTSLVPQAHEEIQDDNFW